MEDSMRKFLKHIFSDHPDFNILTKGMLREQFMKENHLSQMESEEKKTFSKIIEQCLQEATLAEMAEENNSSSSSVFPDESLFSISEGAESDSAVEVIAASEDFTDSTKLTNTKNKQEQSEESELETENKTPHDIYQNDDSSQISSEEEPFANKKISPTFVTESRSQKSRNFQQKRKFAVLSDSSSDESGSRTGKRRKRFDLSLSENSDKSDNEVHSSSQERKLMKKKVLSGQSKAQVVVKKLSLSCLPSNIVLGKISKNHAFATTDDDEESTSDIGLEKPAKRTSSLDKDVTNNSPENSSSKENDDDEGYKMKKKSSRKNRKESSKSSSAAELRIQRLKKFLNIAGVRVRSYNTIFEDCRSTKAKTDKLLELLNKAGLKGKPTIEKCKKLRKKRDTEKEVNELDMSNIIESKGRSRRNSRSVYRSPAPDEKAEETVSRKRFRAAIVSDDDDEEEEDSDSQPFKRLSALKGIIDSEGSD